jgi:hypothetical protein
MLKILNKQCPQLRQGASMKNMLLIVILLLFADSTFAQETNSLEDYLFKETNKKYSFISKQNKSLKLVTFSDPKMKIRFLLLPTSSLTRPEWSSMGSPDPYAVAISATIDDADTAATFNKGNNSISLVGYYTSPECLAEIDLKEREHCFEYLDKMRIAGKTADFSAEECSKVFIRPEGCIKDAIILSVRGSGDHELGSKDFSDRMKQMGFQIQEIILEENYLVDRNSGVGTGPGEIHVYTLKGKPIAFIRFGVIAD